MVILNDVRRKVLNVGFAFQVNKLRFRDKEKVIKKICKLAKFMNSIYVNAPWF